MSKVAPKISSPGSIKMPEGSRNTSAGEHARGGALAQPGRSVGTGKNQGSMPLRKPPAGLANTKIGQKNPDTGATATVKPKRKGIGSAFFGEY
jgi:hypothetical protein